MTSNLESATAENDRFAANRSGGITAPNQLNSPEHIEAIKMLWPDDDEFIDTPSDHQCEAHEPRKKARTQSKKSGKKNPTCVCGRNLARKPTKDNNLKKNKVSSEKKTSNRRLKPALQNYCPVSIRQMALDHFAAYYEREYTPLNNDICLSIVEDVPDTFFEMFYSSQKVANGSVFRKVFDDN